MSDIFALYSTFVARSLTLSILFLIALRVLVVAKPAMLGSLSFISVIFTL